MNTVPIKVAFLPAVAGRAFLAGLLFFSFSILFAAESEKNQADVVDQYVSQLDPESYSGIWVSSDQQLVLVGHSEAGRHSVCPHLVMERKQAFCRHFDSPMVGACGDIDQLILILARGDIHRVNSALIRQDGRFEPAYRPQRKLDLATAHVGHSQCKKSESLPEIMAISSSGIRYRFDGKQWLAGTDGGNSNS